MTDKSAREIAEDIIQRFDGETYSDVDEAREYLKAWITTGVEAYAASQTKKLEEEKNVRENSLVVAEAKIKELKEERRSAGAMVVSLTSQRDELEIENSRLREALSRIARMPKCTEPEKDAKDMHDIAVAALKPTTEEA
jgi:hypothetical protein